MRSLFGILLLALALPLAAQPVIELCSHDCTTRDDFHMQDATWQRIRNLFDDPGRSPEQERDGLARAIALVERDILRQVASRFSEDAFGEPVNDRFSNPDETRNTARILILLLDQGLIKHHLLRRSETRHALFGPGQSTAVIQSRDSGGLYAVDATSTGFGKPPLVQALGPWKDGTPIRKLGRRIGELFTPDETRAPEEPDHE